MTIEGNLTDVGGTYDAGRAGAVRRYYETMRALRADQPEGSLDATSIDYLQAVELEGLRPHDDAAIACWRKHADRA